MSRCRAGHAPCPSRSSPPGRPTRRRRWSAGLWIESRGKTRPKTEGAQHAAPLPSHNRACLRREAGERLADIAIAQPLQCTVAQLANPLASHTQHPADLFQRVLPAAVQTEVQTENLRITPLQGVERLLDLVRQEAIHRLIFRVRQILGDEAL